MNLSLSSSFDKMVNPYSDFLGLYGGGADDLVERRGGGGAPSVNLMEELLGSLIPPRSNMSLLGAGLSTSMPRGDSATECLREELSDASDVDERVLLLPVTNLMMPLVVTPCCTHSKTNTQGFLAGGRTIYRRVEQTRICGEFLEIFGVDFGGRIFSEL